MIFSETCLTGAYIIDVERRYDERGFFARTWCKKEFAARGLETNIAQCNLSYNEKRGTLRGMHYQSAPHAEVKLVSCIAGAIYDVMIDLRQASPTFKSWYAAELTAENRRMLYIPEGFAHGFLTLEDNSAVVYQMSEFYHEECAEGIRWNDPGIAIDWPFSPAVIAIKDTMYSDYL